MTMIIKGMLSAALCCLAMTAMAQNDDAILFSVDDMEIPVSEFRYIYEKNNRNDADYTQASLQEYLDLYVKFKLKVNRAIELRLDTITALQEELAKAAGTIPYEVLTSISARVPRVLGLCNEGFPESELAYGPERI